MKRKITSLTDEQRGAIPEWNERWKRVILSTDRVDRERCDAAINGMYDAAGLARPIIVHVASPMQAAFVGGIAAAAWWLRGNDLPGFGRATEPQIQAMIRDACAWADHALYGSPRPVCSVSKPNAATYAATSDAMSAATRAATYAATSAATSDATDAATRAATYAATRDATRAATRAATSAAARGPNKMLSFAIWCACRWDNMYNGGNLWASWCGCLSFWRDVVELQLDQHAAYAHYERACIYGGPRIMHAEFCIVADRPTKLRTTVDDNGVHIAHCDDGPSHEWADGIRLWHINGVRVDEQVVMRPETQTVEQIEAETNEEVRRIRIERFGWPRYIAETNAETIDYRRNDIDGTSEALVMTEMGTRLLCACRSTARVYAVGVPGTVRTCEQAQSYLMGGSSRIGPRRIISAS